MDRKSWLKFAAGLSFVMAACQALIAVWPAAAEYVQAPPKLLNDHAQLFVVGGAAALIPVLFGLYALSGAGVIRRLPLLRTVLVVVGTLFLLRGLFIILTFLEVLGVRQGPVLLAGVATHLVFLSAGIAFFGGAVLSWKSLNPRYPAEAQRRGIQGSVQVSFDGGGGPPPALPPRSARPVGAHRDR